MSQDLGPISVSPKARTEPFHHNGQPLGFDVLSFWRWSASDLLSNAMRGIVAEYLVARALGDTKVARAEWDPFDATTKDGIRVEVKPSSYLQSWHQNRLSRISFSTRPTFAWEAETNSLAEERKRQADPYVFFLLDHKEQATVDPLDLAPWTFFVISTERLNVELDNQKSVGLNALRYIGAEEVRNSELAAAVHRAVSPEAV